MIKILSGAETADTGSIEFEGRPVSIASTGDAMALGIATVYQEPQLFSELTVSENIFTGREIRRRGRIDWPAQTAKVVELLGLLGLPARYSTAWSATSRSPSSSRSPSPRHWPATPRS